MNQSGDSNRPGGEAVNTLSRIGPARLTESLQGHSRRFVWQLAILGLSVAAMAALVGSVDRAMQRLTRATLKSILVANTSALQQWLEQAGQQAQFKLEPESVNRSAAALLAKRADNHPRSWADLQRSADFQRLASAELSLGLGWALLDLKRTVVAANEPEWVGRQLDVPQDAIERIIRRQTTVSRPFPIEFAIPGTSDHHSVPGGPIMCAMAPVIDDGPAVGALAILIDPLDRFTKILSIADVDRSGETYAFDRHGVLLSQSRFESELRRTGLLADDPRIVSPLNVEIRDPGVDLTRGGHAALDRSRQPLTEMADQATRGATGENVQGYGDYRGVPVVGAWCWLPAYGIGVATEMAVAEAYSPTTLLRRMLYAASAVVLVGITGSWAAASARRKYAGRPLQAIGARRLGRYELGDLIRRGGMGDVYHGRHPLLNREVAIKVLESDHQLSPQTISRFEREVQMTAQLRHPNTIDIYDFGRVDAKTFYYVMEYVDGITLQELVDRFGRQSPARVIHLLLQVCGSLSEAHALGMVHRDIKPSNLLLTARSGLYDMVKVLDFGLVKQIQPETDRSELAAELTQTDGITGTPTYMSPESVRDATTADARSDLYSVGAVGYILLTGEKVFDGESSVDVCLKQLREEPRRPSDRIDQPLPEDLQNVIMSCLRKSPEDRPQSADDLADSLRHCHDAARWTGIDAMQWWESGIH